MSRLGFEAHRAGGTVDKVVPPPNSTNATPFTVKLFLINIIKEPTNGAKVSLSKHCCALPARLPDLLSESTLAALHLLNLLPVEGVVSVQTVQCLVRHLAQLLGLVVIVAKSAGVDLATAGSNETTLPCVMATAKLGITAFITQC
jgi:hypothetical protein